MKLANMNYNAYEVLETLKRTGYNEINAEKLEDALNRGIPLTGYQASLMYLPRRYGKSFMAYVEMTQQAQAWFEEGKKEVYILFQHDEYALKAWMIKEFVDTFDYEENLMDKFMYKKNWMTTYKEFLRAYYPDINMHSVSPTIMKLSK